MPWIKQAAILMGPPIVLITAVLAFIRESMAMFGLKWDAVDGSPKDHARGVFLWLCPLLIALAYLILSSGTWITGGKRLQVKEIICGSIILWVASTLFYRHLWKPWLAPKLEAFSNSYNSVFLNADRSIAIVIMLPASDTASRIIRPRNK